MIYMDFICKNYSEQEIREFIEKYPEKLNRYSWRNISIFQNLSEDFIRDFQDYLYLESVLRWQDISEELLIEFIEKIDTDWLKDNKNIPEDVRDRIINFKKLLEIA